MHGGDGILARERAHRTLCVLPDARRAPPERLVADIQAVSRSPVVSALLDAVDAILLVLNRERQIVAANGKATAARGKDDLVGRRPGEALACVNAQATGGCGTAPACEHCGALSAILGCHDAGGALEAECLMRSTVDEASALELNVRATPIAVEGHAFTVVSLRDVSSEKRRDALEQIFLHDVLNTVAGLRGWVSRLQSGKGDPGRHAERIETLTRQLEREIRDHRALVLAEQGTLVAATSLVRAADLLADLELVFATHWAVRDRRLLVERVAPEVDLETDPGLLLRVLVNMVANALEATPAGGEVRVRCAADGGAVTFAVHNAGVMPPEVQARIFHRSFSTKARRGRGLGTYSMKLLGERYLGGAVSFVSTEAEGTVFTIRLPTSLR
jgi:signal transduction histidine kinase